LSAPTPAAAVLRRMSRCEAFRISEHDTNYFALIFDGHADGCDLVAVVEIFEPGGATPPNSHPRAHELFFVLEGEGVAVAAGRELALRRGDALLVRPGGEHVVRNTGPGKLYCLTVMVPDDDFAALIRRGIPVTLDAADRLVLEGMGRGA
jgi:mannose-6-phosphate isomerase-like protein (cupin superfamily)